MTTDTTGSDIREVADLARAATSPRPLEPGGVYLVHNGDGTSTLHDLRDPDEWPERIAQTVHMTTVDSLLAYWDKHFDPSSDVYADRERRSITLVLDAHHGSPSAPDGTDEEFRARWQSHRAVLTLAHSDPLKAWLAHDGKLLDQVAFAEFVEDQATYVVDPVAADLLEMAQHFQATIGATFKSGHKLISGQRQFEYTEQIDATVRGDSVAVPNNITLHLPVWRGATTAEELVARVRFRINHGGAGKLGIGYKLVRPTELLDAAFEAEVSKVETHVGRPVLRGTAAGG